MALAHIMSQFSSFPELTPDDLEIRVQSIWANHAQPWINALINNWVSPLEPRCLDDYSNKSLYGRFKPDGVLFAGRHPHFLRAPSWAMVVGELKRRRKNADAYTDTEMKQLFDRCRDILKLQPDRERMFGYLSDLKSVLFVRVIAVRDTSPPQFLYDMSEVELLVGRGGVLLLSLLAASHEELFWSVPKIAHDICRLMATRVPLSVGTFLGAGTAVLIPSAVC